MTYYIKVCHLWTRENEYQMPLYQVHCLPNKLAIVSNWLFSIWIESDTTQFYRHGSQNDANIDHQKSLTYMYTFWWFIWHPCPAPSTSYFLYSSMIRSRQQQCGLGVGSLPVNYFCVIIRVCLTQIKGDPPSVQINTTTRISALDCYTLILFVGVI